MLFRSLADVISTTCRLYLLTWHVGLFVTLTLGQVGAQGKKQEYW
jgi:hypothetical protein